MAAQIVADVKYVEPLSKAKDWWTWASSGPGSRRGLNRLLGRPTKQGWTEKAWREQLAILHSKVRYVLSKDIHAQDVQNCLCETDKYNRILLGEGRPKQKYLGTGYPS